MMILMMIHLFFLLFPIESFNHPQSNNTKRKEYVLRLQRTSPSQFWAIDSRSVLFQGVVLRVVLSSILLDFFKGKVDKFSPKRDTLIAHDEYSNTTTHTQHIKC